MSSNPSVDSLLSHNQLTRKFSVDTFGGDGSHSPRPKTSEGKFLKPIAEDKKGQVIAVFTSGGDSSGMNAAVRAVVRMGLFRGCKMYFIREGYQGMVDDTGNGEYIVEATWSSVSGIIHKGGTEIGSARCTDFRERSGRLRAAENLLRYGITNLVVIGGDGSLTGANLFRQEWSSLLEELLKEGKISAEQQSVCRDLHIVGMVGSIDNDFCGTDMTIGTDTALHRILESIDAIVTTASSHQRTFILEVMGRHCGYLALVGALTSEADFVFIPESPPEEGWEKKLCDKLRKERDLGQRLNIILVAEGAIDRSGKPITAEIVRKIIVDNVHHDARITVLGHVQRGGSPSAFDRILGCRMGAEAIAALLESTPETAACVVSLSGNQAVRMDLMTCVKKTQEVALAMKEGRFEDAVVLRGRSFQRNLEAYKLLTEVTPPEILEPKFRVGVVCIGAPACGMNAAIRSFVRNINFSRGAVWGFFEGIDGLIEGNVSELTWDKTNGLTFLAGTAIGTRRTTVSNRETLRKVVDQLEKLKINGLLIIGGFEAFQTGLQLYKGRKEYPQLKMPICVIPATISNNVPGTDFSLGTDTAVNEITEICDRIRRSAEGTKKRVFIIETMGGYCGYLATMAGLAGGADTAYIFEEPFGVKDVIADVDHMIAKMREGVDRGLVLRNEKANPHYDTNFIFHLYAEEGKKVFSTRFNILGHMQQGASPSPFDRNLGTKMASKASLWFQQQLENSTESSAKLFDSPDSAVLIGLRGRHYQFTPLSVLEEQADFDHRLPKSQWYLKLRNLLRILAKHDSVYKDEGAVQVKEVDSEEE